MTELIAILCVVALPIVLAITLHEAAHGYVARYCGDDTAERAGRISLNPLRHIDPVGTVLLPLALLAAHYLLGMKLFLFGWAKPVPVDFRRLRRPKQDLFWVAGAGPAANALMALCWGFLLHLGQSLGPEGAGEALVLMANGGIEINLVLMVFNLVPLPPLDGGRIAVSLLPNPLAGRFARIEPWGMAIVILLLYSGVLPALLGPFLEAARQLIDVIFDLK